MRYFEDLEVGVSVAIDAVHELTEEEIIAFAKKWDPQPFHIDPAAALLTPMKGLTASSSHTYAIICRLFSQGEPVAAIAGLKYEIEVPEAARPGDILSLSKKFMDKRISQSKPDRGLVTTEAILTNQEGKVVMRLRTLALVHCRPPKTRGSAE